MPTSGRACCVTLRGLASGAEPLGLPALGGLFAADKCPDLDAAELPNKALLAAVRALCFFRAGAVLARINYRDMDTEELGSVYESLLELQPADQRRCQPVALRLRRRRGRRRGARLRPQAHRQLLHARRAGAGTHQVRPRTEDRRGAQGHPIRVPRCWRSRSSIPASGSGHFLLAAARRIAAEVARLDADERHPRSRSLPPRPARGGGPLHLWRGHEPAGRRAVPDRALAGNAGTRQAARLPRPPPAPRQLAGRHPRSGDPEGGHPGQGLHRALRRRQVDLHRAQEEQPRRRPAAGKPNSSTPRSPSTGRHPRRASTPCPKTRWTPSPPSAPPSSKPRPTQQLAHERLRCDLFCAAFFAPKTAANATKVPLSGDLVRAAEGQPMRPGVAELTARTGRGIPLLPLAAGLPRGVRAGRLRCRAGQSAVGTHQAAGTGILRPAQPGDCHRRQCGRPHPADRGTQRRQSQPG